MSLKPFGGFASRTDVTTLNNYLASRSLQLPAWLRALLVVLLLCLFACSLYCTLKIGEARRAGPTHLRSKRLKLFWFLVTMHIWLIPVVGYFVSLLIRGWEP